MDYNNNDTVLAIIQLMLSVALKLQHYFLNPHLFIYKNERYP
jgi:hypothetical protein